MEDPPLRLSRRITPLLSLTRLVWSGSGQMRGRRAGNFLPTAQSPRVLQCELSNKNNAPNQTHLRAAPTLHPTTPSPCMPTEKVGKQKFEYCQPGVPGGFGIRYFGQLRLRGRCVGGFENQQLLSCHSLIRSHYGPWLTTLRVLEGSAGRLNLGLPSPPSTEPWRWIRV